MNNFLVVGFCGSMGKRRIRCLKRLGVENIYGFDISSNSKEVAEKLEINYINSIDKFSGSAVIISTPPDHHLEYIKAFLSKGLNVFCEAAVIPEDRHFYSNIKNISAKNGVLFFPSATIKFKESIEYIKKVLESEKIGKVLSYDYRFAQNLRTWHPYQDIKDFYVSVPETGAGREMAAFELSWLTWLFGCDCNILGSTVNKRSEISKETKINDLYSFLIEHENNNGCVGNVSIDVYSHKPYRYLRITGALGNIEYDWIANEVKTYNSNGKLVNIYSEKDTDVEKGYTSFSTEKMYVNEVKDFINSFKNSHIARCNIDDDYKILTLVEKIETL